MPSLPSLPEPNGPYAVGATTFIRSIPKDQQEVIGTACVRTAGSSHTTTSEDGLRPALLLEEVAFTVYYPADVSKHSRSSWLGSSGKHAKGMSWFLDPVAETLKGYEHFSGEYLLILPIVVNTP
jgi:platelet-activating factor acetylhydrolase